VSVCVYCIVCFFYFKHHSGANISTQNITNAGCSTDVKVITEDCFDHKNLNLDCPEFKDKIASNENFAWVIYRILKPLFPQQNQLAITLYETDKNYVEVGE
jgi:hypothetical protein